MDDDIDRIAAAKIIFVLRHYGVYFEDPMSIVDLRDGGFDSLAGFAAAFVVIGGLIPIMIGEGTGSEVMQRIAAPMVAA